MTLFSFLLAPSPLQYKLQASRDLVTISSAWSCVWHMTSAHKYEGIQAKVKIRNVYGLASQDKKHFNKIFIL